jgi:N6-adenosine-specific RNA methylase IME4
MSLPAHPLAKYDAACRALAEAVRADEVMHVRLEAKAIEAVARVAQNIDLELSAAKLRIRAEARLGAMLAEAEDQGLLRRGRVWPEEAAPESNGTAMEPLSRVTLKEIGVEKKLSAHARKLDSLGPARLEQTLERLESETRKRGRLANDVVLAELATRNADSRRALAQELSDCAALLPEGRKFPVVYADPPWHRKAGIGNRAYENHYGTMAWDGILAMPVAQRVLPDAWLFLWIPRAHLLALHPVEIETPLGRATIKLPLAYAVAKAWGFDAYSTCFVWTKTDDACPDDHGTGLIAWDQDEILCLFKRGAGLPKPDICAKFGSNHRERAGAHSEKPAFYRDMISAMTGNVPVLELFAREDDAKPLPAHFFTYGNQSTNSAEMDGRIKSGHDEEVRP